MYPCKPQFYYIKVGCNGVKIHGHVFMMNSKFKHINQCIQFYHLVTICFFTLKCFGDFFFYLHSIVLFDVSLALWC